MSDVKIAIIGAGFITRIGHLPGYAAAGVDVAGLCDVLPERAEALAKQYPNVRKVYGDWREMLERERPDVVSVCLPNVLHEEPVLAALEMGAHVLCEKPLAPSVASAERMFAAAHKAGRTLMAAQNFRWAPGSLAIKGAVDRGEIGHVYYSEATALRRLGIPSWGDFHRSELSAGGPLLDIGVHMLDLALWLMGNPRATRVSTVIDRRFGHLPEIAALRGNAWDPDKFDVEDFAVAFVRLEGGGSLLLRASWAAHLDFQTLMSVRLVGTEAGATTEPAAVYRLRGGLPTEEKFTNLPQNRSYELEVAHFLSVVRGDAIPLVREEETMNVQRILNAAYTSAAQGSEVEV
ncbi:MAG: Gfo/Idh/MocA family oxidoreductase [Chloroflexi bacterium]|nr:Gfo/Idh/MocA family oxidoreductase [Chloroflexota bacterium]